MLYNCDMIRISNNRKEMVLVDYRRLMVKIMKEIVENDYWWIYIDKDGNITGDCNDGFILEDSIVVLGNNLESELRKDFNIPDEIPLQKLELGYINEIYLKYDNSIYDDEEMQNICDELYYVLGDKFEIMEIDIAPI